ncbi:MAG: hypothetical protein KGL32_08440, partial [candidate division NC10 bacterium]|nr:hypothetical protein [candidate division NC10 bacterium]
FSLSPEESNRLFVDGPTGLDRCRRNIEAYAFWTAGSKRRGDQDVRGLGLSAVGLAAPLGRYGSSVS